MSATYGIYSASLPAVGARARRSSSRARQRAAFLELNACPKGKGTPSPKPPRRLPCPRVCGSSRPQFASFSASSSHYEQSTEVLRPIYAPKDIETRRGAAGISSEHPPSIPDPRPAYHNVRSISTEPSCPSHIRAPRTPTIAIQRRTRQIFTAGNLPRFRK